MLFLFASFLKACMKEKVSHRIPVLMRTIEEIISLTDRAHLVDDFNQSDLKVNLA